MDGVIKHNVNGFLSSAGNADALFQLIRTINHLSEEQISKISSGALNFCSKTYRRKCCKTLYRINIVWNEKYNIRMKKVLISGGSGFNRYQSH